MTRTVLWAAAHVFPAAPKMSHGVEPLPLMPPLDEPEPPELPEAPDEPVEPELPPELPVDPELLVDPPEEPELPVELLALPELPDVAGLPDPPVEPELLVDAPELPEPPPALPPLPEEALMPLELADENPGSLGPDENDPQATATAPSKAAADTFFFIARSPVASVARYDLERQIDGRGWTCRPSSDGSPPQWFKDHHRPAATPSKGNVWTEQHAILLSYLSISTD